MVLPLVCIDVDGTLVGPTGKPTSVVWDAADAAVERGQHLALTTARGAIGPTYEWARRLDPDGWHVFQAGAALVHTGSGEVREMALSGSVLEVVEAASARHSWTLEHHSARGYVVNNNSDLAWSHADLMGVPHHLGEAEDLPSPTVRAQFVVPHSEVRPAFDAIGNMAAVSSATSPVMPGVTFVSITAHGATKAGAIERIATEVGTTLDRVMMVGDGHNDLEAVKDVGHGVAMGNGEDEVKEAADYVVAAVEDDGLAEALALSAEL
ncbi:MAG: HAD hydrolase family protein [Acidimicrobiales bacterium]